jgi:type IV secretory pathway TrbD component
MGNDGYEVAIHRSLTEPILLMGVPRPIAILNSTLLAALVVGTHSGYSIPVCLIIHFIAVLGTKKDPQFFDVLKRVMSHKSYYDV